MFQLYYIPTHENSAEAGSSERRLSNISLPHSRLIVGSLIPTFSHCGGRRSTCHCGGQRIGNLSHKGEGVPPLRRTKDRQPISQGRSCSSKYSLAHRRWSSSLTPRSVTSLTIPSPAAAGEGQGEDSSALPRLPGCNRRTSLPAAARFRQLFVTASPPKLWKYHPGECYPGIETL